MNVKSPETGFFYVFFINILEKVDLMEYAKILNVNDLTWRHSHFSKEVWVKDLGISDGYSMQLVKFEPGASFPKHQHDKAEFIYMIKGELIQNGYTLKQEFVSISGPETIDETIISHEGCVFLLLSSAQ